MWAYRACLLRVIDADTVELLVDTGFDQRCEVTARLAGVYAPELRQAGGTETRAFVTGWFATVDRRRTWPLYVITEQTGTSEPVQRRTFTRYVARVFRYGEHPAGVSLNEAVAQFLAEHPGWGGGAGAGRAA